MILEPKHKNIKGPLQIEETVETNFCQEPYIHIKHFRMILF